MKNVSGKYHLNLKYIYYEAKYPFLSKKIIKQPKHRAMNIKHQNKRYQTVWDANV